MRKFFSILLFLSLQHVAVAHKATTSTEVPIKIIQGMPYMELTINGKGPFLFGFDTGFGGEMELDSALAVSLGIKPTGKMEVGDASGRNNRMLDLGVLDQLQVGDYIFQNTNVILRNRRVLPGMEKVSGILGMALFSAYTITIDYPGLKFRFEDTPLPPADNLTILNYTPVGGGVPQIDLKVGDLALKAVVDVRSMSGTFKIPEQIISQLHFMSAPVVIGRGRTVSNEIIIHQGQIQEPIQFGKYKYEQPIVTYPALNEDVIIGASTLQSFQITIDQENQRIQLLKLAENASKPIVVPAALPVEGNRFSEYVGSYEGGRELSLSDGMLYIRRPGGMLLKMIETAKDTFTLERVPQAVLHFERDEQRRIVALKVMNQQGAWEQAKRLG